MNPSTFFTFLLSLCFSFNMLTAQPVITNVSPTFGPASGGTSVIITGSGFTGTTAVDFGTTSSAFFITSDTSITAFSPPHAPQVVNIFVTAPSGTSLPNDNSFFTFQGDWKAYIPNNFFFANTVTVIDTATNTVIKTIHVGTEPGPIALTPDGSQVYVGNMGNSTGFFSDTVSVIGTATDQVVNTIPVGGIFVGIVSMAMTPDGTKDYVVEENANTVTVIDIATQTVIAAIPVGSNPFNIAITPDSKQAYVVNRLDNTVSVIDTTTNTVSATIPVGGFPTALTTTPDGTKLFVINNNDNTVSVIDTATNTVITTVNVGGAFPDGIAITPDGTQAYVTNGLSTSVAVINTTTYAVSFITVGLNPDAIAITPDGKQVYVANSNGNSVSVIDTSTNTVSATIPVGITPEAIAITPDGQLAYVVNNSDNTVTVINTNTNTVIATIPTGFEPVTIGITADQAPLAQFTISPQGAGLPSTFDASTSVSPTGTIANYFWDFGDGATLNTSNPVVTHTYLAPGTYIVTLIVTNTAGTSLTQILYFTSYSFQSGIGSPVTYNNGGPTAERIHSLTIGIVPPSAFTGCIQKNKFLNKTECILNATWLASPTPGVFYRIFQNGILVKEIPANSPLVFKSCLSKCSAGDFEIAAVGPGNVQSSLVPITITGSCCH